MTALDYPYDDATPYRPSVDDLGGDAMIDDANEPPGAGEPQAATWNNFVRVHAGRERTGESVRVTINFDGGGAPFVESAVGMRTTLVPTDFSLTDNGVGDTTIEWAVTLLPPQTMLPCAFQHSLTPGCIGATAPTGISVRVVSTTHAGVADDIPFTVEIR